jgi:hypothetical protein
MVSRPKGEKSEAEDPSEFASPGANSRAFEPTPRTHSGRRSKRGAKSFSKTYYYNIGDAQILELFVDIYVFMGEVYLRRHLC